jgi:hypothetical protein
MNTVKTSLNSRDEWIMIKCWQLETVYIYIFFFSLLSVTHKLNLLKGSSIKRCVDAADNEDDADDFDCIFNMCVRKTSIWSRYHIRTKKAKWWCVTNRLRVIEKENSIDACYLMTDWWHSILSFFLIFYYRYTNQFHCPSFSFSLSFSSN